MSKSIMFVAALGLLAFGAACSRPEPEPVFTEPAPVAPEPTFNKL